MTTKHIPGATLREEAGTTVVLEHAVIIKTRVMIGVLLGQLGSTARETPSPLLKLPMVKHAEPIISVDFMIKHMLGATLMIATTTITAVLQSVKNTGKLMIGVPQAIHGRNAIVITLEPTTLMANNAEVILLVISMMANRMHGVTWRRVVKAIAVLVTVTPKAMDTTGAHQVTSGTTAKCTHFPILARRTT